MTKAELEQLAQALSLALDEEGGAAIDSRDGYRSLRAPEARPSILWNTIEVLSRLPTESLDAVIDALEALAIETLPRRGDRS